MGDILLLALGAALNPTLVAASTLMMLLPNAKRLMLGYLLGALMTSITLGLIIISKLDSSGVVSTTQNTLSPAATAVLGVLALVCAGALRRGGNEAAAERRRARKQDKAPPRWQQALGQGSARVTFVVGALLTLPGASYLAGLNRIDKLNYSTPETVALVVAFNLIMLALLEIPLLGFAIAPGWTVATIDRAKVWMSRNARAFAATGLTVVGGLLVIKAVIEFVS
jgi:Sap, sulfolipid-1-addressing protein